MTLGRTSANKIKIKTDGEAGLRAVGCACCNPPPCDGCGSLSELIDSTSITIGGFIDTGNVQFPIPPKSVLIVDPYPIVAHEFETSDAWVFGGAGGDICGAGNSLSYNYFFGGTDNVGVGFSIVKHDDECKVRLTANHSMFGLSDYSLGGGGFIFVPLSDLIGTHSFEFPVTGCYYPTDEEGNPLPSECNTINWSASISIS